MEPKLVARSLRKRKSQRPSLSPVCVVLTSAAGVRMHKLIAHSHTRAHKQEKKFQIKTQLLGPFNLLMPPPPPLLQLRAPRTSPAPPAYGSIFESRIGDSTGHLNNFQSTHTH